MRVPEIVLRKTVTVHRGRSQSEMLQATGCRGHFVACDITIPPGEGEEVEVCFFRIRATPTRFIPTLMESVGISPDGYTIGAVVEDDPSILSQEIGLLTQWGEEYLLFSEERNGEKVYDMGRRHAAWSSGLLVGGVIKNKVAGCNG